MRGRVLSYREIATPPGPGFRLTYAAALGRLLPVGAETRELGSWLAPLLLIAIAGVAGGILAGGLPAGPAGPVTVGLLAIAAALAAAGLSGRVGGRRIAVPALVGVGMCAAGLDLLADGTGYVVGYMAVVGLALRTSPRVAVLAGSPVVAAIAAVEATDAVNPAATTLAVLSAFGFLFTISHFAAARPRRCWRRRRPRARPGSGRRRWPSARAWPATCMTCWPIACPSWPCSWRRRG
jgi:hypothetical protein